MTKLTSEGAKVTRPSVFAGKIWVGMVKKIHTKDRLSGEKFKFLSISKHSSLVEHGVVWFKVKTYQTDWPVKKYKLPRRLLICLRSTVGALQVYGKTNS